MDKESVLKIVYCGSKQHKSKAILSDEIKSLFMYDYFKKYSLREAVILTYFVLSLVSLSVSDETPILIVLAIVANFANAARLVRKLPLPEDPEDEA